MNVFLSITQPFLNFGYQVFNIFYENVYVDQISILIIKRKGQTKNTIPTFYDQEQSHTNIITSTDASKRLAKYHTDMCLVGNAKEIRSLSEE